jgi:prephenate dehydrogenase
MVKNATIFGGSGQMGSLFSGSFLNSGIRVTSVDLYPPSHEHANQAYIVADVTRCEPELEKAIHGSDCVCICLPEQITIDAAPHLVSAMSAGALWVDTLSVKGPIMYLLATHARDIEILSINPMFAPALGWARNSVAVVESGSAGPKADHLKQLLKQWGVSVQNVTADQHDRLTTALQVATHAAALAFGATLLNLNYDVEAALKLATPPHRILLGLLYRIISQNPEVYWDIQAHHPHAAQTRQRMSASLGELQSLVERGDINAFKQMFRDVQAILAPRDKALAGLAESLITAANSAP